MNAVSVAMLKPRGDNYLKDFLIGEYTTSLQRHIKEHISVSIVPMEDDSFGNT